MNRSIFDARHAAALRRAAAGRVVLAFDFDGTLAPIVADFGLARLRRATHDLLRHVAKAYPTVVLTGRSVSDTRRRLRGIPLAAIVGNHGLEGGPTGADAIAIVRRWRRSLRSLTQVPGVVVEDKNASLAIHYRASRNRAASRRAVVRALASLAPRPRLVGGKALVNVLPDLGVDKGTALRALIRKHRAHGAIYVGDDVTDEDVFGLPASVRILTIRVGRARWSAARYHIASQRQIDILLALLLDLRSAA